MSLGMYETYLNIIIWSFRRDRFLRLIIPCHGSTSHDLFQVVLVVMLSSKSTIACSCPHVSSLLVKLALMQNSGPPQCCHYNCIFAYIGYLTQTIILKLNVINQHSQVYLCFTNIAF